MSVGCAEVGRDVWCGVVCGGVWARLAAHPRRRVHREESVGVASVQRVPAAMGGWWGGSENCAPSCVELRGELRRIARRFARAYGTGASEWLRISSTRVTCFRGNTIATSPKLMWSRDSSSSGPIASATCGRGRSGRSGR